MTKFLGTIILLTGLALAGFAALLVYADLVREVASQPVQHLLVAVCGATGVFCVLVGARLVSDRPTPADVVLLSPTAWKGVGGVYFALAVLLLVRGRLLFALLAVGIGGLCFQGARAIARFRAQRRLR
ncbi:MAG: hypothetical protein M3Z21_06110 [Pseudomonadota bacterium]|nr:hypothetical protein [Pseudomonadota bacterium]